MKKFTDLSDVKVAISPVYSSAALTGTLVNATGYGRAEFKFLLGVPLAGASFNASIWNAPTSGGTMVAITSAALAQITAAASSCVAIVDVSVDSSNPWLQASASVANSNWAAGAIVTLYNGVKRLQAASPQQIVTV